METLLPVPGRSNPQYNKTYLCIYYTFLSGLSQQKKALPLQGRVFFQELILL